MKKKIILLLITLLITGCNYDTQQKEKKETKSIKTVEVEEEKDNYVDDNPIKLGLYMNKKITQNYQTPWIKLKDICSLEVYFTTIDEISIQNQKEAWNKYYNTYQNIDKYKIGYNIYFIAEGKEFNKNILNPNDINDLFNYIQIYLYDDINQPDNTYYSHLTNENYNNNTIISSIKITAGINIEYIESNITITAFTYDYDDFDDNNKYKGNSKFTTIINKT